MCGKEAFNNSAFPSSPASCLALGRWREAWASISRGFEFRRTDDSLLVVLPVAGKYGDTPIVQGVSSGYVSRWHG